MIASPLRPRHRQESGIAAASQLAHRGTPYGASLPFATTTHLWPLSDPPSRKSRSATSRTGTARSIPGRALASSVLDSPVRAPGQDLHLRSQRPCPAHSYRHDALFRSCLHRSSDTPGGAPHHMDERQDRAVQALPRPRRGSCRRRTPRPGTGVGDDAGHGGDRQAGDGRHSPSRRPCCERRYCVMAGPGDSPQRSRIGQPPAAWSPCTVTVPEQSLLRRGAAQL